jgi:hypothetical protein
MGIDTRYWGPSGWQLLHYIAFHADHPEPLLNIMHLILPCRFCRESTTQFVKEHPLKGDPAKWLYEIHNMVNNKLRTQCKDDPAVINPGPDPTFEEVSQKYQSMKLTNILGRDFLFSVAMNYPDAPTEEDMELQRSFMNVLSTVYPVKSSFKDPQLDSRKSYSKWMYDQLKSIAKKIGVSIPTYRGYVQRLKYYESGCDKKTYRGKTCRRTKGGRTKTRDHKRTHRVAHSNLLLD